MALKKTIPSYKKDDGTWEDQRDIDMHPLEEAEIRAHWAIHDAGAKVPLKPTKEQEHEWIIDNGAEFVKLKREEWQKAYDEHKAEIEAAMIGAEIASKAWCDHVELCRAHELDPDTFDGDAREKLTRI